MVKQFRGGRKLLHADVKQFEIIVRSHLHLSIVNKTHWKELNSELFIVHKKCLHALHRQ